MRRLQRRSHNADIAGRIEGIIRATPGQGHEIGNQIAVDFGRIHEIGHAEPGRHRDLVGVQVDPHDLIRTGQPKSLNYIKSDTAQSKHDSGRTDLDLGGIYDGPYTCGDAAADVADLVERSIFADLGKRDFRQDGVVREGRAAHVMQDRIAIEGREPRCAVWHQALTLRRADLLAQVRLGVQAILAFTAFGRVERNNVIAGLQGGDPFPDFQNDSSAFVAQDRGKQSFRISARQGEFIGVADACGLHLDQHLARAGAVEIYIHDFKGFSGLNGDGGFGEHGILLLWGQGGPHGRAGQGAAPCPGADQGFLIRNERRTDG